MTGLNSNSNAIRRKAEESFKAKRKYLRAHITSEEVISQILQRHRSSKDNYYSKLGNIKYFQRREIYERKT